MTSISYSPSLAEARPDLALQWCPTNEKLASDVSYGSGYKARWICSKNSLHQWEARVNNRTANNAGCPMCSGRYPCVGETDLASKVPSLALEWDSELNLPLTPESVTFASSRMVSWVCSADPNHRWKAKIANRYYGKGCPYCSNQIVEVGINDLTTTDPDLAREWHPTRNTVPIESVSAGSIARAWWVCDKGHEWSNRVFQRGRMGTGCSRCAMKGTSKIEIALRKRFSSLLSIDDEGPQRVGIPFSNSSSMSVDILGHSSGLRVVIEYDGSFWHKDRIDKDFEKTNLLLEGGFVVIRIRESPLPFLDIHHNNLFQIEYDFQTPNGVEVLYSKVCDILTWT